MFKLLKNKSILSWCMYDWANSAFSLTVMAGFFPIFFKSYWCQGVETTISTARLGLGNALAGLLIALLSPVLGALADAGGNRKKFLLVFALIGLSFTGSLFFIAQEFWFFALTAYIIASIGFNAGNLFYDSLLIDISEKDTVDLISSMGFSIGYLGCGLLFLVNVFMVLKPSLFGLTNASEAVRYSFLSASSWWLVFSIPLFVNVQERVYSSLKKVIEIISEALKRLKGTVGKISKSPPLYLFLIAYWFYIDGVNTFVLMAVDFGLSIGLPSQTLLISLLVVQFVAFPSVLISGLLSKKFGGSTMILICIGIYIAVCLSGAFLLDSSLDFILFAALTAVAQGGIQALSRSYFAKLVPPNESAEYFGFFNVVGRFAVIIGPGIVGAIAVFSHKLGFSSHLSSRFGMASTTLLFIAGALFFILAERFTKKISL